MSQDYDLYLRLLSRGFRIDNLPVALILYTVDDTSISSTKSRKRVCFSRQARRFYHQRTNRGQDDYQRFDPQAILSRDTEERPHDPLGGLQNYINIIVYEDKKKALAMLVKNALRLPITYIFKKAILLLTPLPVMRRLRERNRRD